MAVVKPGRVLFELADVNEATAREALRLAAHKLPCKTKFVARQGEFEVQLGTKHHDLAADLAAEEAAAAAATEAAEGTEKEAEA